MLTGQVTSIRIKTYRIQYKNHCHRIWRIVLITLGILFCMASLAMTAIGTRFLRRYSVEIVEENSGVLLIVPRQFSSIWIFQSSAIGLVLFSGCLSFIIAKVGQGHQERLVYEELYRKRIWSFARKYGLFMGISTAIFQFVLFFIFLVTTVMSAGRLFQWEIIRYYYSGCPSELSKFDCRRLNSGFIMVFASSLFGITSILFFMLVNAMGFTMLGARHNKVLEELAKPTKHQLKSVKPVEDDDTECPESHS